jgi:hypothetical protein
MIRTTQFQWGIHGKSVAGFLDTLFAGENLAGHDRCLGSGPAAGQAALDQ